MLVGCICLLYAACVLPGLADACRWLGLAAGLCWLLLCVLLQSAGLAYGSLQDAGLLWSAGVVAWVTAICRFAGFTFGLVC